MKQSSYFLLGLVVVAAGTLDLMAFVYMILGYFPPISFLSYMIPWQAVVAIQALGVGVFSFMLLENEQG